MEANSVPNDRREERYKIVLPGHCSDGAGRRSTAEISDLSTRGCKVRTSPLLLTEDATVWIKLGKRDPLKGQVRWQEVDTAGVNWENPLHPAILDHIYAMHDAGNDILPAMPSPLKFQRRGSVRRVI